MSVFRKTVLASAILGAGLASTAGVASAHASHHDGGCSNGVSAESSNSSGRSLGDTEGGAQDLSASNTCDILNGNKVASANNVAGGDVVNGDTSSVTRTVTTDTTETSTSTVG
ncbi:hypothetical protein [Actinomycetospora soli]|uniref:hypothetical protein n=1 Tax=Actinomycetospora soli TaxID=2893887 RepID=UPI001E48A2FF|nr:hypothetical protein [Actinomycetospora soli]MCD2189329.1 hypothetical protein [Actinomycetospora soli]